MNENIRLLLVELMKHQNVVSSWGLSNIKIASDKLSFEVSGFLYKGEVSVVANSNRYAVRMDGRKFDDIALQQIVSLLDELIEEDKEYVERLVGWLSAVR